MCERYYTLSANTKRTETHQATAGRSTAPNKDMHMKGRIHIIICTLILFCSREPAGPGMNGHYRSGEFEVSTPLPQGETAVPIDFSQADDACRFYGYSHCSGLTADAEILFSRTSDSDTLYSSFGILDLGRFGTDGLEKIGKLPLSGYIDKTPLRLYHIYAIKTSEGHYGALFYKEIVYGGYDRNIFRWAYRADGSNDLTPPR